MDFPQLIKRTLSHRTTETCGVTIVVDKINLGLVCTHTHKHIVQVIRKERRKKARKGNNNKVCKIFTSTVLLIVNFVINMNI